MLKEPLTEELEDGTTAIRLEAIEEFMEVAICMENIIHTINEIVDRKEVSEALEREPVIPVIQALLDIKTMVKKFA